MLEAFAVWALLCAALTWAACRWPHHFGSLSWADNRRTRGAATRPGPVPINKTNGSSMDTGMIADREGGARAPKTVMPDIPDHAVYVRCPRCGLLGWRQAPGSMPCPDCHVEPVEISREDAESPVSVAAHQRAMARESVCPACDGTAGIADDPDGACDCCAGRGTA